MVADIYGTKSNNDSEWLSLRFLTNQLLLVFFFYFFACNRQVDYFAFRLTALIGLHKIMAGAMHHWDYRRLMNSRILEKWCTECAWCVCVCAFRYFRMNQFPGACKIYAIFFFSHDTTTEIQRMRLQLLLIQCVHLHFSSKQ